MPSNGSQPASTGVSFTDLWRLPPGGAGGVSSPFLTVDLCLCTHVYACGRECVGVGG